jgi:hypothetical protein
VIDLRSFVEAADPAELPAIIGQLAQAQAVALARLTAAPTAAVSVNGHAEAAPETWIGAKQAAGIAGVSVKTLYEWARGQRWANRPTKRSLRIAESGFRRWLASRP